MRRRLGMGLLVPLLLGAAAPGLPPLTREELAAFAAKRIGHRSYPEEPIVRWERDLKQELATAASSDRAADALAPRYGLPNTTMRELVRLWLTVEIHGFDIEKREAEVAEVRRRMLALLAASKRAPLVLIAVAESLDQLAECRAADFDAMMAGTADSAGDAWRIANAAPCHDNFLRIAAVAPQRVTAMLARLANWGSLEPRQTVPLYAWLTSDATLARITGPGRDAMVAELRSRYLTALFNTGLGDRAVVLFDGLTEPERARILASEPAKFTAEADGLPFTVEESRPDDDLLLSIAASYALAGRTAEAQKLFATSASVPKARAQLACAAEPEAHRGDPACKKDHFLNREWLLLDHFLNRPADDPYPLAELLYSAMSSNDHSWAVGALRCRVLAEPHYASICRMGRDMVRDRTQLVPEPHEAEAERRADAVFVTLPGYAELRAQFHDEFRRVAAQMGGAVEERRWSSRTSVTPEPPPFAQRPLPAAHRGTRPDAPEWPKTMAQLPEGHFPVRIERAGAQVTVIGVSQTYDPSGEISRGGYWVHRSDDGGRSWQRPLYTGLAERFPYVVTATSRMPLRDGDALDLEVEVAEIDTASITYPPVGLRTRRRETGLYLRIPIADLERDSDGDGLTDLTERHLLLDRARTDGGTPFVVGTTPPGECAAPPPPERLALMGLLGRIFESSGHAIVEPLDRAGKPEDMLAGWQETGASVESPILLAGDPRDYACMRPNRLMIVYGEQDIAQLQRFTPDFRTVTVPPIVFNRARTRGYVQWSAGWVGGTYVLRLVDGRWQFDAISSWIT